jgi:hypothetical protein
VFCCSFFLLPIANSNFHLLVFSMFFQVLTANGGHRPAFIPGEFPIGKGGENWTGCRKFHRLSQMDQMRSMEK